MNRENHAGWILILGTFVFLFVMGKISLLVLLIPLAILLAFAMVGCSGHHETKLTDGVKKG
jgi:hypothetical protein